MKKHQSTKNFYKNLPALNLQLEEVLAHRQYFHLLPGDWSVVITDIKNSTAAVERGKYQEVNLLASATVIVALNLAREGQTEIPFIYGGDGASLLVPPDLLSPLLSELAALRNLASRVFGLNLRIGNLTIRQLEEANELLKVAKVKIAPGYQQALFLDNGLAYAEQLIKDNPAYQWQGESSLPHPNLSGLQCRWKDIRTTEQTKEIVCLIVDATDFKNHDKLYGQVLAAVEKIYGQWSDRHPLHHKKLGYPIALKPLLLESYVRFGKVKPLYVARQFLKILLGKFTGKKAYRQKIVEASDILKLDGTLKMILAGTKEKRQQLIDFLKNKEGRGELVFGHSVARQSFITCFVPQKDEYINFLDGSGGGYIKAAKELKAKRKKASPLPVVVRKRG